MSSILTPGQRPDAGTILGDHQRRIQRLEATDPLADCGCVPSGGLTPSEIILAIPDLMAFWKLNEETGDIAFDSANGYDLDSGTDSPPTWGAGAGPPGETSAQFGTGLAEKLASFPAMTGDFSGGIFAYRDTIATGFLMGQGDPVSANNNGWALNLDASGPNGAIVFIGDTTGGPHITQGDAAIPTATWKMIAFRRGSNIWRLNVNGVAQASSYDDSGTNYTTTTGIALGDRNGSGTGEFAGRLSYGFLVARAMTDVEFAAVYDGILAFDAGGITDGYVLTADSTSPDGWSWQLPTIEVQF